MSAELREREAWENRYKHGKASRTWDAIANENEGTNKLPTSAECRILAEWMAAYEAADAAAEAAFRSLTSSSVDAAVIGAVSDVVGQPVRIERDGSGIATIVPADSSRDGSGT